ncbi:17-beta-hydroxysteroid dehydrogenase 13-like isoform X2 [Bradysia coprophila]|uniref:17-beta-hydroxysteroid dehydrogenase 13-like isoform X2 n=1 Tax=Bradysia coprophila TaxID=38358 RepID=UPI00187D80EE|nr:17-beta-hydroxysteroid dehydrogenase 13-like isoform X2 [Bradysia coprophila]
MIEEILRTIHDLWDLIILLISIVYMYVLAVYKYFVPPDLDSLDGKITGSAGGIGRQICLQLATTTKAMLICWDVDKQSNDKFVSDLIKLTAVKAFSYQVDVSDRSNVQTAIEQARKEIGDIQIVINNAGIMPCRPFLQQSPVELEKSFEINVLSHFWILREILPRMIEVNDGHIVTVCSAAGLIATRNLAAYSGTKHAVHGFIESLKEEIRHDPRKPNIRFTTVYPFACSTGMMSGVKSYSRFPFLVKTILQPEEVAEKLVLGLRGNIEHVYIPDFISFAGTTAKCLLPEVQRLAVDFMNCYVEPA